MAFEWNGLHLFLSFHPEGNFISLQFFFPRTFVIEWSTKVPGQKTLVKQERLWQQEKRPISGITRGRFNKILWTSTATFPFRHCDTAVRYKMSVYKTLSIHFHANTEPQSTHCLLLCKVIAHIFHINNMEMETLKSFHLLVFLLKAEH